MGTLATLLTEALAQSGRPDKTAVLTAAIKQMVFNAHRRDFFPKDRVKAIVTPAAPAVTITEALPTRWRKFSYIRPLNSSEATLNKVFTRKDPGDVFSFEGYTVPEYYYVLGTNVFMESADSIVKLEWCYYVNPDLSSPTATTWVTENYEQEIIDGALGYMYKKLGDTKTAREFIDLWINTHLPRILGENLVESI